MGKKNSDAPEGRKTLWGFLIVGILLVFAGSFAYPTGMPASLPQAEIIMGACLICGAVASLVIVS